METRVLQILRLLIGIALLATAIYFLRSWVLGYEVALPWQTETTYQARPFLINYFELNGKPGGVFIDQVLALERFFTEDIIYSTTDHYLLLWGFIAVLIITTAFISYLDRSSYLLAAGAICLMLTQLQIEELNVYPEYITYILIAIFLIPSYYFQAFKSDASTLLRLSISLLFYGAFIITCYLQSPIVNIPIVSLSYGILGPLIFSTMFLLFIAGENIYSIFRISTTAQPGKKGLIHFTIIGVIYVGICFMLFYQKEIGLTIQIDYLDPRFLIVLSLASAYYSFDQRHAAYRPKLIKLFKTIMLPLGGLILLLTYTFAVNSANDSLQSALDWMVIITHMCMGVAYFFYALINFIPELIAGLPVWKAFYSGQRTAILTLRLMGFVLCIGSFFYLEYRPYYDAQASQYGMLGDLAKHLCRKEVAKSYYDQAIFNHLYSFKANYSLYELADNDFDQSEARNRISRIFRERDNAIARIKLSNDFAENDRLYRALETLQGAQEAKPNWKLSNNLGLAHYYYANYDSAFYYFENGNGTNSATNLWATRYVLNKRLKMDIVSTESDLAARLNQQAVANLNNWEQAFDYEPLADSIIKKDDLYYLYNAALSRSQTDYAPILNAIEYYLSNPANAQYGTFLMTAKALAFYHSGEVNQAFQTLDNIINRNPNQSGFETFLKAIWYFDQGQAEKTVEYTNLAQRRGYQAEQVRLFVENVQQLTDYSEKADISEDLSRALSIFNEKSKIEALIQVASKNAFDVKTTLLAIDELKNLNAGNKVVYDLLVDATRLNDASPALLEAYILQCENMKRTSFADSALDRYSLLVPYKQFFELSKKVFELRKQQSN